MRSRKRRSVQKVRRQTNVRSQLGNVKGLRDLLFVRPAVVATTYSLNLASRSRARATDVDFLVRGLRGLSVRMLQRQDTDRQRVAKKAVLALIRNVIVPAITNGTNWTGLALMCERHPKPLDCVRCFWHGRGRCRRQRARLSPWRVESSLLPCRRSP